MPPVWIEDLFGPLIALMGVVSGIVVALINKRGTREKDLIDQLQEERDSALKERDNLRQDFEKRLADQDTRIEQLATDIAAQAVRERLFVMYIYSLQQHINEKLPPPPPQWPEGLFPQK